MGKVVTFVIAQMIVASLVVYAGDGHKILWGYGENLGPQNWGQLSKQFEKCHSGLRQSPVDLKFANVKRGRKLTFLYKPSKITVVDNGHTVQVDVGRGNNLVIDGQKFELKQFHFHAKSEHTFSGRHYPLEVHFVHQNAVGELAVVGVMFEPGNSNRHLAGIWKKIPAEQGKKMKAPGVFNPIMLIPDKTSHYHYMGSLTTPPCSEGVNWTVMNTPVKASRDQIEQFRVLYNGNYRPVQPLFGRQPASY